MTTDTIITTTTRSATGRGNVAVWTLQVLVALFFLTAAALPKLLGQETAVEMFDDIGFGDWFRYFVGACELAGAIGLVIPRVAGLAASCLVALLFGACVFLVSVLETPELVVTPIALAVPLVFVARARLPQTDLSPRLAIR